ncbi:sigma-54-dependent transcriptional regulator [Pseudaquidulcibacter saccharophilus]|uniref:sigma-54-dependent transcriptional regulator n=1 Tax=Pseudaquidulcibacter saccharophilus TaxID=2831900 RepID=UPI001EFEF2D9|nr:sigma-54 dependent transcriptional regulator [Pseudaquidulcibacter saccharophilus]
MRLMIVGSITGPLAMASKIAMDRGAKVMQVDNIDAATNALRSGRGADLLMVEVSHDIEALIRQNEVEHIFVPVVACGISTDARTAAMAIRAGAKEFIPLPPDPELIAAVIAAVSDDSKPMIAKDPAMIAALKLAEQVAPSDASIMISGESGVGKEVMARFLHSKSRRADKPFISVNCAAIPDNLLESELFGHEKGAFTGAIARRIGKFEEANGGTLLLDEISEMDLKLQAKLLRAIQERVIDRVGGSKPVPVDIRIIATTNRELIKEVNEGNFREDLYYRLNVINLEIPPLRTRQSDIVPLAEFFAKKFAVANGQPPKAFSQNAKDALLQNGWRGNVRELENTIHRAVLLSRENQIEAVDLGSQVVNTASPVTGGGISQDALTNAQIAVSNASVSLVGRTIENVEQEMILETLKHCLGNRTHAAVILGISIRTLRNKLKQYQDAGIDIPAPHASEGKFALG